MYGRTIFLENIALLHFRHFDIYPPRIAGASLPNILNYTPMYTISKGYNARQDTHEVFTMEGLDR